MKRYLSVTSTPFYGAVVALPMLLIYEICLIWDERGLILRNAPESWFRSFLLSFGLASEQASFLLMGLFFLILIFIKKDNCSLTFKYFNLLLLESIIWGLVSGVLLQTIVSNILLVSGGISGSAVRDFGLAIGAGLFEELFFRVFLTSSLIWLLERSIHKRYISVMIAVLISSFLFASSHYTGTFAEQLEIYSFVFRFVAGIWFASLYTARGFAIVCLTHAIYDINVIFF